MVQVTGILEHCIVGVVVFVTTEIDDLVVLRDEAGNDEAIGQEHVHEGIAAYPRKHLLADACGQKQHAKN